MPKKTKKDMWANSHWDIPLFTPLGDNVQKINQVG